MLWAINILASFKSFINSSNTFLSSTPSRCAISVVIPCTLDTLIGIKKFDDLPNNAKIYVKAIEEFIETKISSISTSPERKDTILLVDPFKN